MALTQERAELLAEILTADVERGKNLLALEAQEALTQINALGNDFTLEELNEYGNAMDAIAKQGELDADALDNIAGGVDWKALAKTAAKTAAIVYGGPAVRFGYGSYKLGQWAARA
ncbi:MAG: hypothetical protein FWG14_12710 [Peptococcaceae bacterium]|nr:hypothetical protein [Peptococcaceae bacterium]